MDVHDYRTGVRVKFWNNYYGGGGTWTYENGTGKLQVLQVSAQHKQGGRTAATSAAKNKGGK